MSAGDGWTAATSGTINLGARSVAGGTMSLSNGMLTLSVKLRTQLHLLFHYTVWMLHLTQTQPTHSYTATMALGGATIRLTTKWMEITLKPKARQSVSKDHTEQCPRFRMAG